MTTENNTIKLTLELTAEQWAVLRKAVFTQSRQEEEDAIAHRKSSSAYPENTFDSNYAKIHAERYLIIKETKEQIDDAFHDQVNTYWHKVESQGDISIKAKLSITDEA
jgi:hypothetical protein